MTAYHDLALDPFRPWVLLRGLGPDSSLGTAISVYTETLALDGVSPNTVSAFDADLRLFSESVGADVPISAIDEHHVQRFREFLTTERQVACSPTSLRRRLTAVQSLFRYLVEANLVKSSPVASTAPEVSAPDVRQADLLSEEEVSALIAAAEVESAQGDWRPLLLLSLLLSTGISKAECLALHVDDVDPEAGALSVGVGARRRSLPLDPRVGKAYQGYRRSHSGEGRLFDCTGRNLEYVLARVGRTAGIERNPSFRALRATAAARLHRGGSSSEEVAGQLGISRHTWPALRRRIRRSSQ